MTGGRGWLGVSLHGCRVSVCLNNTQLRWWGTLTGSRCLRGCEHFFILGKLGKAVDDSEEVEDGCGRRKEYGRCDTDMKCAIYIMTIKSVTANLFGYRTNKQGNVYKYEAVL